MKTYSTKANANRAAKNQGIEDFIVVMNAEGKFYIDVLDEAQAAADIAFVKEIEKAAEAMAEKSKAEWLEKFVPYNPQLLLPAPAPVFNGYTYCPHCNIHLNNGYNTDLGHEDGDVFCLACLGILWKGKLVKSSVDNPVQLVWEIADRMWGERRKDIIAECVRQGVAYNTARTQYQAFYKVKSKEGK